MKERQENRKNPGYLFSNYFDAHEQTMAFFLSCRFLSSSPSCLPGTEDVAGVTQKSRGGSLKPLSLKISAEALWRRGPLFIASRPALAGAGKVPPRTTPSISL